MFLLCIGISVIVTKLCIFKTTSSLLRRAQNKDHSKSTPGRMRVVENSNRKGVGIAEEVRYGQEGVRYVAEVYYSVNAAYYVVGVDCRRRLVPAGHIVNNCNSRNRIPEYEFPFFTIIAQNTTNFGLYFICFSISFGQYSKPFPTLQSCSFCFQ